MPAKKNRLDMAARWNKIYREENEPPRLHEPADIVREVARLRKTGTVLDLGVGQGRNALFLATKGFSVVCVDVSKVAIRQFRDYAEKLGVEVKGVAEDITQFEFDQKYDIIISIGTLNLLQKEDAIELIERIKANTKSHGLNAVMAFTELDPLQLISFLFESNELKRLYKGWKIVTYKESPTSLHEYDKEGRTHRHTNADLLAQKTGYNP